MEDFSKTFRKKNRFILEIRYKPILSIIDGKGKIIEQVHPQIEKKYPHWLINGADIVFQDRSENPKEEFLIGLKRTTIITEDIATYEEFKGNVFRLLKIFYDIFSVKEVSRIGFRIISAYTSDKLKDFDDARKRIEEQFLKDPLDLGLKHSDLFLRIVHKNGAYVVGPVKKGEAWFTQNFRDLTDDKLVTKYGIGLDIDSFAETIETAKIATLNRKVEDVLTLSKAIEDALIRSLGL